MGICITYDKVCRYIANKENKVFCAHVQGRPFCTSIHYIVEHVKNASGYFSNTI